MESSKVQGSSRPTHHHTRSTSSVLKSIINPRNHKRNASAGAGLSAAAPKLSAVDQIYNPSVGLFLLPSDHPDAQGQEVQKSRHDQVGASSGPANENKVPDDDSAVPTHRTLHKKTLSSVSLSSLAKKSKEKSSKSKSKQNKPKKAKSHTNLSGLLSRSGSSKSAKVEKTRHDEGDKENKTPRQPIGESPPIYAQYASQHVEGGTDFELRGDYNDHLHQEISLYTPTEYTSSQQRNFHNLQQPTLSRRAGNVKPRPQSAFLPSATASHSQDKPAPPPKQARTRADSADAKQEITARQKANDHSRVYGQESADKAGPKVTAAVAAIEGAPENPIKTAAEAEEINSAFETLLDSRNVPSNMRGRLRSLETHIKVDFIKQDQAESASSRAPTGSVLSPGNAPAEGFKAPGRPQKDDVLTENTNGASSSKRSRPRSRTFTFSKGDKAGFSPSKKQRPDSAIGDDAGSAPMSRASSSKSLRSLNNEKEQLTDPLNKAQSAIPDDFVSYLRNAQNPQNVEVGKLHKLRLVLRNERIVWVDSFITKGGMTEIVDLLQRIMKMEWREEHEDALLHEVLLCFKALCTTSLALQKLVEIEDTIFPALLGMLFDEERKGPSEFTTRGIVVTLLFAHLASASPALRAERARTVLGYVRDPSQEEAQPLGFISSMHQTRPYRAWCKEVVNVTKEVFWIFLHSLNVVPKGPDAVSDGDSRYYEAHFPRERPPVPAAPYVGGVEWDATNYLANHLDLINGVIASLPTREERNALRQDLKVSGFEKMMGGSLRTCKEKFYGAVHDGLKTWVAAAADDGWHIQDVRMGPPAEPLKTPRSSPNKKKKKMDEAPKLDLPKFDLGVEKSEDGDWL